MQIKLILSVKHGRVIAETEYTMMRPEHSAGGGTEEQQVSERDTDLCADCGGQRINHGGMAGCVRFVEEVVESADEELQRLETEDMRF